MSQQADQLEDDIDDLDALIQTAREHDLATRQTAFAANQENLARLHEIAAYQTSTTPVKASTLLSTLNTTRTGVTR